MSVHNFHLPLPDNIYKNLRREAKRSHRPATALAREALEAWLEQVRKVQRNKDLAEFVDKYAGTSLDLDPNLEAASAEHILRTTIY